MNRYAERLRALQAETNLELTRIAALEEELSNLPDEVSAGEVFLFDLGGRTFDISIEWVVLNHHPDDEHLWLIVPADNDILLGVHDVWVPHESKSGPLALRNGYTLWVPEKHFDFKLRTGLIEPDYIIQARNCLASMVRGITKPDDGLDDDNPDYQETMKLISAATAVLEAKLKS